jgi:N-dimethylarginine dimethylaminohydrolase
MVQGAQSETGRLTRVLLKHARDVFDEAAVRAEWRNLGYLAPPDPARARDEYDAFIGCFEALGVDVRFAPRNGETGLDSVYVRDAAVLCDKGAILCRMGKEARRSEPAALEPVLREAGIPIHGSIEPPGCLEGGDVVWLSARTAAVGRGYRTNDEGIRQLRALLRGRSDEVLEVPLPHWRGPGDVFHLMSILSPLDADLALVHSSLLPVPFRERLLAMGIALVDVPDAEFETLGCNVLALGPRHCLMAEGNPVTRSRLEAAGVRVVTFRGEEICRKGGGGPTCLTRPLQREG